MQTIETVNGSTFPLLPLRDVVVYPHMVIPLFVGREKSIRALEEAMKTDKQVLLVAQRDSAQDDPLQDEMHTTGTIASILQLLKLPDGTVKVLVEGAYRASILNYEEDEDFVSAEVEPVLVVPVEAAKAAELIAVVLVKFIPVISFMCSLYFFKSVFFGTYQSTYLCIRRRIGLKPLVRKRNVLLRRS